MSYLNRVWAAASVALANNHSDQAQRLKPGLRSLSHGKKCFSSSPAPDLRPLSGSDLGGIAGRGDRTVQVDDSLRQVMYMSCWGQG
ncbi:unnamed protein product [Cuscuta campestris]|uniref:Uncharacterized protein n=3 Tax=cellular organisms TaxID=131567 RepID=A0A484M360_9ASTE|nr:hypothetical protein DM860_008986 [Cuscuta australis]VFQ83270.1 unnamed protein product [Cuscuta campestris]